MKRKRGTKSVGQPAELRDETARTVTRREFIKVVGMGAAASTIAACGPRATSVPESTVAPASAEATMAPAATAVSATSTLSSTGKEVIMGIGTDVVTMDNRIVQPAPAKSQVMHVVEPLIWPDNDGKPVGILTSEWEPVMDPPGWRFHLREGIKYQNGEPFNANTVKYWIESVLDKNNNDWVHADPRTRMSDIESVKVEDDHTVMLVTKGFSRAMPINLYQFSVVPAKYGAEKGKEFGLNPVGQGHYKFVEYRSKSHLRLEADPQYHGNWNGAAKNPAVTFKYLSENSTRVAALEAGEVHVIDNLPPDAVERVKANPNLDVVSTPTTRIDGMFCHCGRAPFNNLKAREAVAAAVDRDSIVKAILGGMTEVANAPFPPGTLGVDGETFRPYEYNVEKAKQLFKEAGLTNGTKIKVGGPVGRYINDKQIVAAVAGMLSEVGFQPELEQLEFGTYWPKVTAGEYDLFYAGFSTFGYDPVDFKQVYSGWSDDNAGATHFIEQNARVLELYKLANATPSNDEARSHYAELAHLIWDNTPIIQLHWEPNIAGINKRLKGWYPRRDTHVYLWESFLE